VLSEEATNTNCIVFGLIRSGLEHTIYHTRGEHANYYTTDAAKEITVTESGYRKEIYVIEDTIKGTYRR
jgi:hypothetical protein